jgi:radical SAM superfamily enzyme YgiQ (UPF0313 family)
MVKAVLISTYELGRQPFGLASPAAWLREAGVEVTSSDLYQEKLDSAAVREADLVAFYLPMHTATRIALKVIEKVTELNPEAHLCAYGLYAPLNAELLIGMGVGTILGGEFEEGLVSLARRLGENQTNKPTPPQTEPLVSLARQKFLVPDRAGLPALERYAQLVMPDGTRRVAGYTEATRGCKHLCRHCPIVPVYKGQFRVVQRDVVLEDIRCQVEAGAQHITFGDPDFFNGIGHAVALVLALHQEFPDLTYDVVIKVEHLLKHAGHLRTLGETGCAFVTSAVESVDDKVLAIFDKGHTRADFIRAVEFCREAGINFIPTFVTFTPWVSLEGYEELLETLASLDMVDHVPSIQLAIRLLIPAGSRLLEMPEVGEIIGPFDVAALSYRWAHPDPRVDALQRNVESLVREATAAGVGRRSIFSQVWQMLQQAKGTPWKQLPEVGVRRHRATVPYLNEPWYC